MIYFKNTDGDVFAYESEDERNEYGAADLVRMSEADVQAHLNPPIKTPTREQVIEFRRLAYADPLTGSDPLYIEYQKALAMDEPADQVEAAKAAWLDRAAEIALQYPWP